MFIGLINFIKAIYGFFAAAFYRFFANEKQIDRGYEKRILKNTPGYKSFDKHFDVEMDKILNPEFF